MSAGREDAALVLAGGVGPDGGRVDVECRDGVVTAVVPGGSGPRRPAAPGTRVVDCSGLVVLPALAEPHAHIDKAYTADRFPNPTGDLDGAIAASQRCFAEMTAADVEANARRSLAAYLARGCLSVRTHVAVGPTMGLRAMEGVMAAAADYEGLLDVQVVAHVSPPLHGGAGREQRARLAEAIAMGATQVGGTPYRDEDPAAETRACLEAAAAAGVPVDLHTDETLDPSTLTVLELAGIVQGSHFPFAVAASHCVSLGVQDLGTQQRMAEVLAGAGVAVISLPQTNLFLQGRGQVRATPRGITALAALDAAGVALAAGGDNVQDPFNPMGRADPLEAASLLVTAGHLEPEHAFGLVSGAARAVMGLAPVSLDPGSPADLVAVPGSCLREAIAEADPRRVVVRRGVLVEVDAPPRTPMHRSEATHV